MAHNLLLSVCKPLTASRISIQSTADALWRVSFASVDEGTLHVKAFDDYGRLWISDQAFLVVPTDELEGLVNDVMGEVMPRYGEFTELVIHQFPFGATEEMHRWTLVLNDGTYEFEYHGAKEPV